VIESLFCWINSAIADDRRLVRVPAQFIQPRLVILRYLPRSSIARGVCNPGDVSH
jgi:hypothetical protein